MANLQGSGRLYIENLQFSMHQCADILRQISWLGILQGRLRRVRLPDVLTSFIVVRSSLVKVPRKVASSYAGRKNGAE